MQACLACCAGDIDVWVLAQNRYRTRLVRSWWVHFDRELWRIWIQPGLSKHAEMLDRTRDTILCSRNQYAVNWTELKEACRPRASWKESFAQALQESMAVFCTPREDDYIPLPLFTSTYSDPSRAYDVIENVD